jgi:serine protease Do
MRRLRTIHSALAATAVLTAVLGMVPAAVAEKVELRGGAAIRGTIVLRTTDRLVVDLGYRVIEIPLEVVERVLQDEGGPATGTLHLDLYRIEPGREERTVQENISRVAEAVVQVRTPTGLGSGFVIHSDGYVVTNQHVISGEHEITVTVFQQRGEELRNIHFPVVRIIAVSPHIDLALLKVDDPRGHDFATVPLAAEDDLRQGQTVFAVGSPLGLDRTVSAGIVSLTNRVIGGHLFIQTTTDVSPGNSGGPLFNLRGEVVGVNDLKLVGIGVEGLNFAIPVSTLRVFLHNRAAFAFDPRNPNSGFRYHRPPGHHDLSGDGR